MTHRQILLHFDALMRRRRRERVETLVDVNKAFAGGKAVKTHLEALTKKP